MKIALNSYLGYGAHFALRLMAEGHSVDYFLSEKKYEDVLGGIVKPMILDLDHRKNPLNYTAGLPKYDKYDLSIFDLTGKKRQADYSRSLCPTIGDGEINCILEDDRGAGIRLMEEAGIPVPPYEEFTDVGAAKSFIKKTGKRYVFKPDGGQDQEAATTYVSKSAEDLLENIDKLIGDSKGAKFILQEFIKGTEISVEGWFNGEDFYALNCTLEEKKFMNDNVGPNTGCAGNLVFLINSETKLYKEGLAKCKEQLKATGFRGMIDLNTIVTAEACYGLEWTPRFGYDASATLYGMYSGGLGNLLLATASGSVPEDNWKAEFGVSIRLTIPPYPTEIRLKKAAGIPIKGINLEDEEEVLKTYMYDVMLDGKNLVSAGINGLIACPVEVGSSIPEAFAKLDSRIKGIQIPDMQHRTDIQKTTSSRYFEMQKLGWI